MTDDSKPKADPRKVAAAAKPASKTRKPRPGARGTAEKLNPVAEQVAVAERRSQAWKMSLAGADYVTIGRALTRQSGTPHGYDGDMDDTRLSAVVRSDLHRALTDRRDDTQQSVATRRATMIQRHYRALAALWPGMTRGDSKAHAAGLGHMRAIAKLDGLDEPTRVAVSGDDPDVQTAVRLIMDRIAREAQRDDTGEPTAEEMGEPE